VSPQTKFAFTSPHYEPANHKSIKGSDAMKQTLKAAILGVGLLAGGFAQAPLLFFPDHHARQ
jgi:hypothetical protein